MIKKGFTLIELLITIAIIGILSAAVLVGLNPAQKIKQANDAKVKSDVGQVATALQAYYTSKGYFPLTGTTAMNSALTTSGDLGTALSTTTYTYLRCWYNNKKTRSSSVEVENGAHGVASQQLSGACKKL